MMDSATSTFRRTRLQARFSGRGLTVTAVEAAVHLHWRDRTPVVDPGGTDRIAAHGRRPAFRVVQVARGPIP
jgi:hypothetical protein